MIYTLKNTIDKPPHDKTNKMACAPSEGSDHPGHPLSLNRVQADLSLRWAHGHIVGFVNTWLRVSKFLTNKYWIYKKQTKQREAFKN